MPNRAPTIVSLRTTFEAVKAMVERFPKQSSHAAKAGHSVNLEASETVNLAFTPFSLGSYFSITL